MEGETLMPTGYTAMIEERDVTFNEFVWQCARGMGALIMMRDDPMDAPIPERFKLSDYYDKSLLEVNTAIKRLEAMTSAERVAEGERLKRESIERNEEWLSERIEVNVRYNAMLAQVADWNPPTSEHQGLKDFMAQQISISFNSTDYIEAELSKARSKSAGEF